VPYLTGLEVARLGVTGIGSLPSTRLTIGSLYIYGVYYPSLI
jgi:hypothetical protein